MLYMLHYEREDWCPVKSGWIIYVEYLCISWNTHVLYVYYPSCLHWVVNPTLNGSKSHYTTKWTHHKHQTSNTMTTQL